ncbi:hypothetical protein QVD17_09461 [Tagetes erecta]|uniref:Uncharacterized protein n=1 Tax=Tagetes erecta TaxID=13708 RepID=A0AAD8L1I5_TARER|nr:hypothetical protein QVD17_09461 [Tagetes erecta]
MGEEGHLRDYLPNKWLAVLTPDEDQYEEFVLEFLCTFRYSPKDYDNNHAVSFSLGGQVCTMSVPELGVALGFYTQEEIATVWFNNATRGFHKKAYLESLVEGQVKSAWSGIGVGDYDTNCQAKNIRNPCLRYLQRILASTLIGRGEGADKCNLQDIFCLYHMSNKDLVNFASVFCISAKRPRRGGRDARLDLGPYITRIARHVGAFDRFPERFLTQGPRAGWLSLDDLMKGKILISINPPRLKYSVGDGDAGASSSAGPSNRRRRRQSPVQEPEPNPIPPYQSTGPVTMDMLQHQMANRFSMIDQTFATFGNNLDRNFAGLNDRINQGFTALNQQFTQQMDSRFTAMGQQVNENINQRFRTYESNERENRRAMRAMMESMGVPIPPYYMDQND